MNNSGTKVVRVVRSTFIKEIMKKKLEYTLIGYLYALLNIYMTLSGKPLFGIFFGGVACYFFLKALLIRKKENEKDN